MTFNVSPSILIREFDLTTVVPAIAVTPAAFVGVFKWGPLQQRILVDSENNLFRRFYSPSNFNGESWFAASSFLSYGTQCYVVRAANTSGATVEATFTGNATNMAVQAGNLVVQISNTSLLNVGQILYWSNNNSALAPGLQGGVKIASKSSNTITLSTFPTANAPSIDLVFRDPTVYSAVAQEEFVENIEFSDQIVFNPSDYSVKDGTFDSSVLYIARYPGSPGNSLRVSQCDTANQFSSNTDLMNNGNTLISQNLAQTFIVANVGSNTLSVQVTPANTANATSVSAANVVIQGALSSLANGDLIQTGNSFGYQFHKVTSLSTITQSSGNVFSFTIGVFEKHRLGANSVANTIQRFWEFYNLAHVPPGQSDYQLQFGNVATQDELHIVVVDDNGAFTGAPGEVLESYFALSRATDAKTNNNSSNYYKVVINAKSQYIWVANPRSTAPVATAALLVNATGPEVLDMAMVGGDDGLDEANIQMGVILNGWDYFVSAEDVDISLIIVGKGLGLPVDSNTQLATWLINNIAEIRKDCVVFLSPDISFVVNNKGFEAQDIVNARNTMPSSSYGVMDSGYKYMYDRYNDVYRWVPLNGDIAGLCAQVDLTNDPWWSPAGFNRGNIKNVVQLAWNPRESERDILYPNGVNPVVSFRGMGTVLFGDKTMLSKPSAFNRINVRRLFIVLEKSIATASKYTLFEFNDEFTRLQFKAMVNPFLQDVQSRRGITGFLVRCDTTNNTPFVIQNNQFVADIFIRPNYSINWIKLNFIAVPPTLTFEEAESVQF